MKDRIKEIRKEAKLNQTEFGRSVGVTLSAEQKWELGISVPSDSAIMNIVSKYGIREDWLREGTGEMHESPRASDLRASVAENLSGRSAAFRDALVDTLLQLDPDGPEWSAFVAMLDSAIGKMQK